MLDISYNLLEPFAITNSTRLAVMSYAVAVVVFCVLSYLVFCGQNVRTCLDQQRSPPIVPSYIAWLGSAIDMALYPDGFIARNIRRYGPVFFVDMIGHRFLYITAREPIKWALKRPKDISICNVELKSLQSIFDLSQEAAEAETKNHIGFQTLSRHIAKWKVNHTVASFNSDFRRRLVEYTDSWTPEERFEGKTAGFSQVFFPMIYWAFCTATMGMNHSGDTLWRDHSDFHDSFPLLFSGLSGYWVSRGLRARKNLIDQTKALFSEHLNIPDTSKDVSPVFMKSLAATLTQQPNLSMEDVAKLANIYMVAGDNIGLTSFWLLSHVLSHLNLYNRLRVETDTVWQQYRIHTPTTAVDGAAVPTQYHHMVEDLEALDKLFPLLNSTFTEILRYHGKQMFVRRAETDLLIPTDGEDGSDAPIFVAQGTEIIMYMRPSHFDAGVFKEPHTFNPDRFFGAGDAGDGFMLPFGFGGTVCPGRYLATFQIKAVILSLLHHFDIEYVGLTGISRLFGHRGPGMEKRICVQNLGAFGTPLSTPLGDMKVRLKIRTEFK